MPAMNSVRQQDNQVISVEQLNRLAKRLLEGNFPSIWVEGEISNFARPSSGHWYFTLKDEKAQVRCAMFRGRNMAVRFKPQNGTQILLKAKVSLYEGRGDYQLLVDFMEEAGLGALQRAFDELKQKLSNEGLFNPELKKALPTFPKRIGLITSPTGAAVQDMLSVLERRFPNIPISLFPVAVQGEQAAPQIVRALENANQDNRCDVILLGRGGGSIEDLWAFNEETVARAIADSAIPIISAVGHETDFTIADFVADVRAPTPSAAAELASPDQDDWYATFNELEQRLAELMERKISEHRVQLIHLLKRLRHPGDKLREHAQRLDGISMRIERSIESTLQNKQAQLKTLSAQLWQHTPSHRIEKYQSRLELVQEKLSHLIQQELATLKQRLLVATTKLESVSPLATLNRGYSIATKVADKQNSTEDNKIIHASNQVVPGDKITTTLQQGSIISTVETCYD